MSCWATSKSRSTQFQCRCLSPETRVLHQVSDSPENKSKPVGLGLCQFARLSNIDPESSRLNLPYWSGKPSSSPEKPAAKRPYGNNAHCHRRIIERLIRHWIHRREAKRNGDKTDPEDGYNPHGLGGDSEIEWSSLEVSGIN